LRDSILQLDFDNFHDSVETKGRKFPYFITWADFTGIASGTKYDLDFLVSANYGVVVTPIHSKNGKHTAYNVH
jgi:hypothetical protein